MPRRKNPPGGPMRYTPESKPAKAMMPGREIKPAAEIISAAVAMPFIMGDTCPPAT